MRAPSTPSTILSTSLGGIGALLLLMAVHMDLSVIAMIGIILLIGIVKKNGIMLVDSPLEVRADRRPGSGRLESIVPAFMRLPADPHDHHGPLLGGVPLMLGTGTGSEIRQPLATPLSAAWRLSQVLTLYTTPAFLPVSGPAHPKVAAPCRAAAPSSQGAPRHPFGGLAGINDLATPCHHPHRPAADLQLFHDLRLVRASEVSRNRPLGWWSCASWGIAFIEYCFAVPAIAGAARLFGGGAQDHAGSESRFRCSLPSRCSISASASRSITR